MSTIILFDAGDEVTQIKLEKHLWVQLPRVTYGSLRRHVTLCDQEKLAVAIHPSECQAEPTLVLPRRFRKANILDAATKLSTVNPFQVAMVEHAILHIRFKHEWKASGTRSFDNPPTVAALAER